MVNNIKDGKDGRDGRDEGHTKDPTINVQNLLKAAVERLDDLRTAESRRIDELMELRAVHAAQLSIAEAKRIDAIRAVDVNAVSVANERAIAQAAVLANQVASSAETLRALVAATATSVAQQLTQVSAQVTDRLSLLEKAQYERKGTSGGTRDMWGWIIGGAVALAAIASFVIPHLK